LASVGLLHINPSTWLHSWWDSEERPWYLRTRMMQCCTFSDAGPAIWNGLPSPNA